MVTEQQLQEANTLQVTYYYAGSVTLHRQGSEYKRPNGTMIGIPKILETLQSKSPHKISLT